MNHIIPQAVWQKLLEPNKCKSPVPVIGGLSQAEVFRCESPDGPRCLRRWPGHQYSLKRLNTIIAAITAAKDAGIDYVPAYYYSGDKSVLVAHNSDYWELTEWLPGVADYQSASSWPRLKAALSALARLHSVWKQTSSGEVQHTDDLRSAKAASPAVARRLELLAELINSDEPQIWLSYCRDELESELTKETARQLSRHASHCLDLLKQISEQQVQLHLCIRDFRCEHVLFCNDEVTGIVDFGAVQIDEPATDLARWLGTAEPVFHESWLRGLEFYAELEPTIDARRVTILDYASCLLSAVQWARWLLLEQRQFACARWELHGRWRNFLCRLEQNNWAKLLG